MYILRIIRIHRKLKYLCRAWFCPTKYDIVWLYLLCWSVNHSLVLSNRAGARSPEVGKPTQSEFRIPIQKLKSDFRTPSSDWCGSKKVKTNFKGYKKRRNRFALRSIRLSDPILGRGFGLLTNSNQVRNVSIVRYSLYYSVWASLPFEYINLTQEDSTLAAWLGA